MDDYIKRSEALEIICSECVRDSVTSKHYGVSCYEYEKMKMLPAADVRKNVHGNWIRRSRSDQCSVCRYETGRYEMGSNYCPNCGADMRKEDKQ